MISDGWVWMPKKPHGELTCWVQEGWGGPGGDPAKPPRSRTNYAGPQPLGLSEGGPETHGLSPWPELSNQPPLLSQKHINSPQNRKN